MKMSSLQRLAGALVIGLLYRGSYLYSDVTLKKHGNLTEIQNRSSEPVNLDKVLLTNLQQGHAPQPFIAEQPAPRPAPHVPGPRCAQLKGAIRVADDPDTVPEFRVFFNGMETKSNADGFFTFPLYQGEPESLSLVFCKHLFTRFDQVNTVKNIRAFKGKAYRYFVLEHSDQQDGGWIWSEQQLEEPKLILPSNSLVVILDPDRIDHLEAWPISLNKDFITLPRIVLKNDDVKSLKRKSAKSLLYPFDSKAFHETILERRQVVAGGKGELSVTD